jgi:hypothetical protein
MEAEAKIKELEDEFKVLKAEIRNVLLDIREVILERTNPLAEDHETAFIRMDLNTTARAMASEAAAREASKVGVEAESLLPEEGQAEDNEPVVDSPDDATVPGNLHVVPAEEDAEAPGGDDVSAEALPEAEAADVPEPEESPAPRVVKRQPEPAPDLEPDAPLPAEIPPMYQAGTLALNGTIPVSEWLTNALATVSPQELERIIAIHRLWGNMPPNISRALAYLQELLGSSKEGDQSWLKVMQDLDRLAAL